MIHSDTCSMKNRDAKSEVTFQQMLTKEFINSSLNAVPGFVVIGLILIYRKLETRDHTNLILILSVIFTALPLTRFLILKFYAKNRLTLSQANFLISFGIVSSAILWTTISIIAQREYNFANEMTNLFITAGTVGITIAGAVFLSHNLIIAYTSSGIMLGGQIIFLTYQYMSTRHEYAILLIEIFSVCLFFLLRQYKQINKQIAERLYDIIDLKNSYLTLKKSQDELLLEKIKFNNSVRLATIGEISGELTHEINNPLAIINGNSDLLLKKIDLKLHDDTYLISKIAHIKNSAMRIKKIIDMLNFYSGSNESNNHFLIKSSDEVLKEVLFFSEEKIKSNLIELKFYSQNNCTINCKPNDLNQVFLNLISNSIRAIKDLPVDFRKIVINSDKVNETLKISISHSGNKISKEVAENLFNFDANNLNTNFKPKVGLGLGVGYSNIISAEILLAHKGRIYYDTENPLSTVVVELPIANSA